MEQKEKKSFVLYTDYIKHISLLTDQEAGQLFKSIFEYVENGNIPEFSGALMMCFSFISSQIQRDKEKYVDICTKRAEAGRKGGKQKQANLANAKIDKIRQANLADNVIDNDNKNDIDTDIKYICALLNDGKRKVSSKGVLKAQSGNWHIAELLENGINIEFIKKIASECSLNGYKGDWYSFKDYVIKRNKEGTL